MTNTISNTTGTTGTKTTWVFDPAHTSVEFSAKHMMVTTVRGHFGDVSGSIQLDESDYTKSLVEATIDVAGLGSRDAKRDGHLKSGDFFDVEQWPTATFKSTRIEKAGNNRYTVYGDLTVRDVTREVAIDSQFEGVAKSPWGQELVAFTGTTTINRKEFGLTWNVALETGGMLVGENVKLTIEVEATKQA